MPLGRGNPQAILLRAHQSLSLTLQEVPRSFVFPPIREVYGIAVAGREFLAHSKLFICTGLRPLFHF